MTHVALDSVHQCVRPVVSSVRDDDLVHSLIQTLFNLMTTVKPVFIT